MWSSKGNILSIHLVVQISAPKRGLHCYSLFNMRFGVPFLSVLGFAALSNGVAAASVRLRSQTVGSVDKLAEAEFAIVCP